MHILFDNGTPRQLRLRLFGHVVAEAKERGWDGMAAPPEVLPIGQ